MRALRAASVARKVRTLTKKPVGAPSPRVDVIDVLDRVFKKGIVVERSEASDAGSGVLRVSVTGVDVLRTKADGSLRLPPKRPKKKK